MFAPLNTYYIKRNKTINYDEDRPNLLSNCSSPRNTLIENNIAWLHQVINLTWYGMRQRIHKAAGTPRHIRKFVPKVMLASTKRW